MRKYNGTRECLVKAVVSIILVSSKVSPKLEGQKIRSCREVNTGQVGVSFLLRSCCHKKTHRNHYDSGKQQES